MKIIGASYEILTPLDRGEILGRIERIARVCYKSEDRIGPGTASKMVSALVRNGHEAMLEHYSISVLFTVDRGISHELVRHRVASYAQESSRYCRYSDGITVTKPCYLDEGTPEFDEWEDACLQAEQAYMCLLDSGFPAEQARAVLPTSTKTEIVVTANLREWRHIFRLRACGETGRPHVQMMEVMQPLMLELKGVLPEVFGDLEVKA